MRREGYVDPSWPNPHGPDDADIIIYGFVPSEVLCILALALFSLGLLFHLYRIIRCRTWYLIPIVVACIMELIGYSFRLQSSQVDPYRIQFFILNYFFIVVAPVFLSAAIYVCLSRLIQWASLKGYPSSRYLQARVILIGFITCDVIATIVQITGAALIGHAESERKDPTVPNDILLGGLAFQAASFLIYLILLGVVTSSLLNSSKVMRAFADELGVFTVSLWVSSMLVFARTLFRLAETAEGVFGYARTHEAFFGCLDFAPIITAVFLLAVWFPGKYLPRGAPKTGVKETA